MADANGNGKNGSMRQLRWYLFTIVVTALGMLLLRWANHVDESITHQADVDTRLLTELGRVTERLERLRDALTRRPQTPPDDESND